MSKEYKKILFRFYSDVLDQELTETLWASVFNEEKELYKLDNIPFYIPLVASGDIIFAKFDVSEKMLAYQETIEYSGNSVIQIIIMNSIEKINEIRQLFISYGCCSEKFDKNYFSMEVPKAVNYVFIKKQLDELELNGVISYAESCLSNKHKIETLNI